MKKLAVIIVLAAMLFPCTLAAKDKNFGLGIILGEGVNIYA